MGRHVSFPPLQKHSSLPKHGCYDNDATRILWHGVVWQAVACNMREAGKEQAWVRQNGD